MNPLNAHKKNIYNYIKIIASHVGICAHRIIIIIIRVL